MIHLILYAVLLVLCLYFAYQHRIKKGKQVEGLKERLKNIGNHSDFLAAKLSECIAENELLRKRIAELENTAKTNNFIAEKTTDIITLKHEILLNSHYGFNSETELRAVTLERFKLTIPDNLVKCQAEKKSEGVLIRCEVKIVAPF